VFAQASELQRFALNQGSVNLRSLATADSVAKFDLDKYNDNFAVTVNLGEEYMKKNGLTADNETALAVLLHTNVTSFCRDCGIWIKYNCDAITNPCRADTSANLQFDSPYVGYYGGDSVNHAISIGSDPANPSWKLSTPASLFSIYKVEYLDYISRISHARSYMTNYHTYGLLGLGVGGKAASNFKGGHPLFSISMNSAGYGSLIFGKDSSLYDASETPITLTADTNWTMKTKSISFGKYSNSSFTSKLAFDLQHPGISIPQKYWDDNYFEGLDFQENMIESFNLKRKDNGDFHYAYHGKLNDLPNLVFTLEDGKTLTIPPAAYTRKSPSQEDTYHILISPITHKNGVEYTVIGWPVMSYFYTIFEQKTGSEPTITLYPPLATSLSLFKKVMIGLAIVAFIAIAYIIGQRRSAKLQNEIDQSLNSSVNILNKVR